MKCKIRFRSELAGDDSYYVIKRNIASGLVYKYYQPHSNDLHKNNIKIYLGTFSIY